MATRALVGFLEPGAERLIATYNHYDGYPESLGKALEKYYNDPVAAKEVASTGYISFLDPETGQIESKYSKSPKYVSLPDDFEEAMLEIAYTADSFGADYIYIYDLNDEEWKNTKMVGGTRKASEELASLLYPERFGDGEEDLEESFETKWKSFLEEGKVDTKDNIHFILEQVEDYAKEKKIGKKLIFESWKDKILEEVISKKSNKYEAYDINDMVELYESHVKNKTKL